mmetsp:Transcript_28892/g.73758  ORF Transcript_28892/g.73758 Transcript_28892/m.73758 type:complete len:342 (-) Transcript_28892:471-1496(-)
MHSRGGNLPGADDSSETTKLLNSHAKPLQPNKFVHTMQVLGACAAWLTCSTGIILVNRYIIKNLDFSFPMALSALGQLTSGTTAYIVCDLLHMVPPAEGVDLRFQLTHFAPVAAAQGIAMWTSNQLYLLLTVAFIEMARSLLPLFTMLALYMAALEVPTSETVRAVLLTAVGCAMSAYGELALTFLGVLFLAANFVMEAVRLVIMQFLLQGKSFSTWQTLKYIAFPSALMLIASSAVVEGGGMVQKQAHLIFANNWALFIAAATLGLAVNFLSSLIIKLSSATTVKLLAAVRGPLVVLSGVLLFDEQVTQLQAGGYSLALAGFVWYNVAKARQPAPVPPKP